MQNRRTRGTARCRTAVSPTFVVRLAISMLLLFASPVRAECRIGSQEPVSIGMLVEVGEGEPAVVVLHRADVVLTAHRRAPWTVAARGSIAVEGRLPRGARSDLALRPHASLGGVLRTGSSPVAVDDVRVVDERRGLADVEVFVRGFGALRLAQVPCSQLLVADFPPVARTVGAPATGLRPRRTRAALHASTRGAPTAWWHAEGSAPSPTAIESSRGWRRIRVTAEPELTLDAWVRAGDVASRAAPTVTGEPAAFAESTSLFCTRSHEPAHTHAKVRVGAAIVREPGGAAIAVATTEQSFTIWVPETDGWIALIGAPQMDDPCPSPFGFVRATDIVELDVYDRAGVALRIDRERGVYVVVRVDGRAAESGAQRGDIIVRDGITQPRPSDRRPGHVASSLYGATHPMIVRRGGVEIELPALRDDDEERLRERDPSEPQYFDY